jgi:hypothetical protein
VAATRPTEFFASQTAKERAKVNVDGLEQVADLFFPRFIRERHAMQSRHLRQAGAG